MTLEEVQNAFPADSLFETEGADGFGDHTWVADPGAEAVRVLHVGAGGEPKGAEDGDGPRPGGGVDVYFDGEGRLVGVQGNEPEGRHWRAPWGVLHGGENGGEAASGGE